MPIVVCPDKETLTAKYSAAAHMFSDAVAELQRKMGTVSKSQYGALLRRADEARVRSEQARLAMEQHTAVHGC